MSRDYIEESIKLKRSLLEDNGFLEALERIIKSVSDALESGNKILIAGNGGSAADAQHFAAELMAKFKKERRGYPAIALTTDTSFITAWSNDYNFNTIFSRQVESLGRPGDIFFGISTSGNSENIIEAVKESKQMGLKSICLLGKGGGLTKDLIDLSLIVPSDDTPRIQEIHIMLIHIICEEIENLLDGK